MFLHRMNSYRIWQSIMISIYQRHSLKIKAKRYVLLPRENSVQNKGNIVSHHVTWWRKQYASGVNLVWLLIWNRIQSYQRRIKVLLILNKFVSKTFKVVWIALFERDVPLLLKQTQKASQLLKSTKNKAFCNLTVR